MFSGTIYRCNVMTEIHRDSKIFFRGGFICWLSNTVRTHRPNVPFIHPPPPPLTPTHPSHYNPPQKKTKKKKKKKNNQFIQYDEAVKLSFQPSIMSLLITAIDISKRSGESCCTTPLPKLSCSVRCVCVHPHHEKWIKCQCVGLNPIQPI